MQVLFVGSRSAVAAAVRDGFTRTAYASATPAPGAHPVVPLWTRDRAAELDGRAAALLDIPESVLEAFDTASDTGPRYLVYPEVVDLHPVLAHRGLVERDLRSPRVALAPARITAASVATATVVLALTWTPDLDEPGRAASGATFMGGVGAPAAESAVRAPARARGRDTAPPVRLSPAALVRPETARRPRAPRGPGLVTVQHAVQAVAQREFVRARQAARRRAERREQAALARAASAEDARQRALVDQVIAGADAIATLPYRYGGGHGSFEDSAYDCSGSVSYALHAAGLLDAPITSTGFMSYGEPGPGQHITIYANPGHVYMVVDGRRYDTSARSLTGSRWSDVPRSAAGFVVRHPAGL